MIGQKRRKENADKYRRVVDYVKTADHPSITGAIEACGVAKSTVVNYVKRARLVKWIKRKRGPVTYEGAKIGALTLIRIVRMGKYNRSIWLCRCECGKEVERDIAQLTSWKRYRKRNGKYSCGCLRFDKGENSRWWKGRRTVTGEGYVLVYMPNHPNARKKYVLEHVLVMAESIGRPLHDGETVHHKNGIKDDNRLENLELWGRQHGAGQRVEDLTKWAVEHLAKYAPYLLKQENNDGSTALPKK